jgi:hypothetical protein
VIVQAKVAVWYQETGGKEWIAVFDDFTGNLDIDQELEPVGFRRGSPFGPLHLRIDGNFTQSWIRRADAGAPQPPEPPEPPAALPAPPKALPD